MRLNFLVFYQFFCQVRSWTYVEPTKSSKFPLGIVYLEIQYARIKNTCSGSVIGNRTIVTAAHCVDNDPQTITIHLNKGYGSRNFTNCKQNKDKLWAENPNEFFQDPSVTNECVERFIDLRVGDNRIYSSVQHPEYIKTAPKFASGKNGATAWLTSDIAILTVDLGFFKTKQDMMKHSFELNLKQNLRNKKKRKRKNSKKKRGSAKKSKRGRNRGRKRSRGKWQWPVFNKKNEGDLEIIF